MDRTTDMSNEKPGSVTNKRAMVFGDRVVNEKPNKLTGVASEFKENVVSENQKFYKPKTRESKAKYMQVLSILYKYLSDKKETYIKELVYEVLIHVNKAESSEEEVRREILKMIKLDSDDLIRLITHCRDLRDFEVTLDAPSSLNNEIININFDETEVGNTVSNINPGMDTEEDRLGEGVVRNGESFDASNLHKTLILKILKEDNLEKIKFPFVIKQIEETLLLENDQEVQNLLMKLLPDLSMGSLHKIFLNKDLIKWSMILAENKDNPGQLEKCLGKLNEVMGDDKSIRDLYSFYSAELLVNPTYLQTGSLGDYFSGDYVDSVKKSIVTLKPNAQQLLTFDKDKMTLPARAVRKVGPGHEVISIPATLTGLHELEQMPVKDIREDWRETFKGIKSLNPMQTRVFRFLTEKSENGLICAPTGAGKTIVAIIAILKELFSHQQGEGVLDLRNSKIIYLAPMKALAVEIVGGLQSRLENLGVTVREFTGDVHLSPEELARTNIIVSTPEKWDVLSRKSVERTVQDHIRLIIVDEIHLLGDSRGPVIEAIIWRALQVRNLRIIGLSATLPNSQEVAAFMNVNPETGLFQFGPEFRPVPLDLKLVGVTEKSQLKQSLKVKELLFEFISERLSQYQMIIFTHSRKEAQKTGEELKEQLFAADLLDLCMPGETKQLLSVVAKQIHNQALAELVSNGIGFHHAGLSRSDRLTVEDLFANKKLGVLVSTATLAWGVNLPAHTVIIKGTQVYSPSLGRWTTLSMRDLLQMLGRAGRPGFDKDGEGIVLTSSGELKDIVRYLNNQQPLESKLMSRLPEYLNAEIVSGKLSSFRECVLAVKESFLGTRIKYSPMSYGLDSQISNPMFFKQYSEYIINLTHTALLDLEKHEIVEYDQLARRVQSKPIGKVVSHCYLSLDNVKIYSGILQAMEMNSEEIIDAFRVFGSSVEFKDMVVREEELSEISNLLSQCPVPVKSANNDPKTKAIVLLQCYISRIDLEGYVLASDLGYISQNAPRLLKAIFDLACLYKFKSAPLFLNLIQMTEQRLWSTLSPLRQLGSLLPSKIIRKLEQQEHLSWSLIKKMSQSQFKLLVDNDSNSQLLKESIQLIPNVTMDAKALPITQTLMKINLFIQPQFQWSPSLHGYSMPFHLFIFDSDNECILLTRQIMLTMSDAGKELRMSFEINLSNEATSFIFLKLVSESWIGSEETICIDLQDHQRPLPFPQFHEIQSVEPDLKSLEQIQSLSFKSLLPIQSSVLDSLITNWDNVFIGAPSNSGKLTVTLITALRMLESTSDNKVVILFSDHQSLIKRQKQIKDILGRHANSVFVTCGDVPKDYTGLTNSRVVLSTYNDFDNLTRNYRKRTQLKLVSMVVVDDISQIRFRDSAGELLLSRLRLIFSFLEQKVRFVVLSRPIANFDSICEWLEIPPSNAFNFRNAETLSGEGVGVVDVDAMTDDAYYNIVSRRISASLRNSRTSSPTLVIINDKYKMEDFTISFLQHLSTRNISLCSTEERELLAGHSKEIQNFGNSIYLREGCFVMVSEFTASDNRLAIQLLREGHLKVLVVSEDVLRLEDLQWQWFHDITLIKGKHTSEEMIDDFAHSMNAPRTISGSRAPVRTIYCRSWEKEEMSRKLTDVVVLESSLLFNFLDVLNTELVAGTLTSMEDCVDFLTWTLLYRRLRANPSYYQILRKDKNSLNVFTSELVESAINDLVELKCVEVGETELAPTNSSIISAFYNLKVFSVSALDNIVKDDLTLQELIETVCSLEELQEICLEDRDLVLTDNNDRLPFKQSLRSSSKLNAKAIVLFQMYLLRKPCPEIYLGETKRIVSFVLQALAPFIDLCSSQFLMKPILLSLKLCQLTSQQVWIKDSDLLQLPLFDKDLVDRALEVGVSSLDDFFELEDEPRNSLLGGLSTEMISRVAWFANRFPNVEKKAHLSSESESYSVTDKISLSISLVSDIEYSDYQYKICTNSLVLDQLEEKWWILVVDKAKQLLLMVKKVVFRGAHDKVYSFTIETEGSFNLTVLFICESYVGFDSEVALGPLVIKSSKKD